MAEAAAAPVNGTPAPQNGASGGTQAISDAKPAPKTVWDITKEPLKYKTGGKERSLDSWDKVQQRLSFSEAYEEKAKTLEQKLRDAEPRLQKFDGLKKAPPKDFWKGLSEEFGEESVAAAAEEYFRDRFAREDRDKALSPEAKRYKEDAERKQAELDKFQTDAKKRDEEAQQRQHQEQTQQYYGYLNGVIGEALEGMEGVSPDAAPYFMPAVAAALHRTVELGIEPTPQLVAQEIYNTQRDLATGFLSQLSDDGLVDLLEAIVRKGEDGKPGRTARYGVMKAWVDRRNRKSVDGETPQQEAPAPADEEPRAARRYTGKETKKAWSEVQAMLKMTPPLRTK